VLESAGIATVYGLANPPLGTMQALRAGPLGDGACKLMYLASALISKCSVAPFSYDGQSYADTIIVEGNAEIAAMALGQLPAPPGPRPAVYDTGCLDVAAPALSPQAADATCAWVPTPRMRFATVAFHGEVYLLGGYSTPAADLNCDVWYRVDHAPVALITQKPASSTSDTVFAFSADNADVVFQYRVLSYPARAVVRDWSPTLSPLNYISWLKSGVYRFEVRAVDAAGNHDLEYTDGRNVYQWEYIAALPIGLIVGLTFLGLALAAGAFWEYRRRIRKKVRRHRAISRDSRCSPCTRH
jgi:hypothetical protein